MNIQGFGSVSQLYATNAPASARKSEGGAGEGVVPNGGTSISISDEANVKSRIDEIAAKPATQRTEADVDFLHKNDKRLAESLSKSPDQRTAEDVDQLQKAGGLVNTMANLSPAEKKLYDELVAKGDTEAVRGMNLIALSRMGGAEVTLSNGTVFDPGKTELTARNVRELFSQVFVGADDQDQRSLEALAKYLDGRLPSAA